MLKRTNIAFIGGGSMATAIIGGMIEKKLVTPDQLTVSDPFPQQLEKLAERFQVNTTQDNLVAVKDKDVVVMAVKPQVFGKVADGLKGQIPPEAFALSIMAGVPIKKMVDTLQHERIVRVMPNTPAQVGKGMSVWNCTATVSDIQKEQAQAILSALGEEIFVEKEEFLDMATAMSGSAPAYVFLFMEAMVDAGVHLGFSRAVSEKIVYQNVEGAAAYARLSGQNLTELRNMVTSPGGTTAEALYELEKHGFRHAIAEAIWAAYEKSRHLGGLDDK